MVDASVDPALQLRPYRAADASALAQIHNRLYPDQPQAAAQLRRRLAALLARHGRVSVAAGPDRVWGYAAVDPAPGLPGVADLQGFIAPEKQRQGVGRRLLAHLLAAAQTAGFGRVAHPVPSLDSPAARFLQQHGFTAEHEEWRLALPNLRRLPPLPSANPAPGTSSSHLSLSKKLRLHTYPPAAAVGHFLRLYAASFGGHPWNQPYSAAEVTAELTAIRGKILFLVCDDEPVGLVWPRLLRPDCGEIEPLAVAATHQRRGYGRWLLLAGLHWLAARGARRAVVALWRSNEPALHLYQQVGFRHEETVIYLVKDINSR